jgi:hypothetical protein
MSDTATANSRAAAVINRYPHLKQQVIDSWELMSDEISEGSSEDMEVERFLSELNDITEGEV